MTAVADGEKLPRRIVVKEILSSRYVDGQRPDSWDLRRDGQDVVRSVDGEVIRLTSSGTQSPPQPGWEIMLVSEDGQGGFGWTLYGIGHA